MVEASETDLIASPRPAAGAGRADTQVFGWVPLTQVLAAQQNNSGTSGIPPECRRRTDTTLQPGALLIHDPEDFNGTTHAPVSAGRTSCRQ